MPSDSLGQVFINLLGKVSSALYVWVYKALWASLPVLWAFFLAVCFIFQIIFFVCFALGFKTQPKKKNKFFFKLF